MRTLILLITLLIASISLLADTTVTLQQGLNGYTGVLDCYLTKLGDNENQDLTNVYVFDSDYCTGS